VVWAKHFWLGDGLCGVRGSCTRAFTANAVLFLLQQEEKERRLYLRSILQLLNSCNS
jgi:hypothetical protein